MQQQDRVSLPEQEELIFNPNEYTEKELLKLVYRELHSLIGEFNDYRKNNTWQAQITEQDKRISQIEEKSRFDGALAIEKEKRGKRLMAYGAVGLTILSLILKFIVT